MDTKSAAQQPQDASDDFNSSEYTHSNLDPAVATNDASAAETTTQASQPAHDATEAASAESADASHTRAMEAVMQLAQAASQQQYDQQHTETQHHQHGHVENPEVHHDALPVSNGEEDSGAEKRGNKRRPSLQPTSPSGRGSRASKTARNDEDDDVAAATAAAAAAAAAAADHLPFPESWSEGNIPAEIQNAYQQHLAQAHAHAQAQASLASTASTPPSTSPPPTTTNNNATTAAPVPVHDEASPSSSSNPANFKPTRQLSTSKRAAQNRAAQRAFRERRDKYVKVLESKAARLETAIRVAAECKRRYTEALQTIDGLRQDNHTLRVALAALSGSSVDGQAPPAMKADELLATLPDIPMLTTDEEESVLAQGHAGSGQQSLDSLSAVAAAAAAAVPDSSGGVGDADKGDAGVQHGQGADAAASKAPESVALPQPPNASATSPTSSTTTTAAPPSASAQ